MTAPNTIVACRVCGAQGPRADMFGVEPDLLCPRCASGVRSRMQVRVRKHMSDRRPIVTLVAIGIAAALFVLDEFVYPNPTLRATLPQPPGPDHPLYGPNGSISMQ